MLVIALVNYLLSLETLEIDALAESYFPTTESD